MLRAHIRECSQYAYETYVLIPSNVMYMMIPVFTKLHYCRVANHLCYIQSITKSGLILVSASNIMDHIGMIVGNVRLKPYIPYEFAFYPLFYGEVIHAP